jgi:acetyl-CoA decarbonylase/synthase, CODH/ACS complex subunit gamma
MVLMAEDVAVMAAALEVAAERKPLVYAATADNFEAMTELAKTKGCPLAVKGKAWKTPPPWRKR